MKVDDILKDLHEELGEINAQIAALNRQTIDEAEQHYVTAIADFGAGRTDSRQGPLVN